MPQEVAMGKVVQHHFTYYQSLVAEWLRLWVNLDVLPPLSDWEVAGLNPTVCMSRLKFLSRDFYPASTPSERYVQLPFYYFVSILELNWVSPYVRLY